MTVTVTLISANAASAVSPALVDHIADCLPAGTSIDWLAENVACDLRVESTGLPVAEADHLVRSAIDGAPVDCVVQAVANRRMGLLVADMDSTIIGQECIDELAAAMGIGERVAAITERAMRGEIDFEPALRERVALLRGLHRRTLRKVLDERIHLRPGARTVVRTMRDNGAYTALVSGGFTCFTEHVAAMAGFHESRANVLEFDGDLLTGTVVEPVLAREAKLHALEELTAHHGIDPARTMAVGDGANDLAMIAAAGLGVAFHAKPVVAAAAPARIDHADLDALLYIQGYRQTEFTV